MTNHCRNSKLGTEGGQEAQATSVSMCQWEAGAGGDLNREGNRTYY